MEQERIYNVAVELTKSKRAVDIRRAMDLFESISDYKDASDYAKACRERLQLLDNYDVYKPEENIRKPFGIIICVAIGALLLCAITGIIVASLFGEEKKDKDVHLAVQTSSPAATPTKRVVVSSTPKITPTKTSILTPEPTPVPTPMTPSILSANIAIGDTVQFGAYEQDNVLSNGYEAIEWIVLDQQDGKALLISKNCLCNEMDPFFVTWENSERRTWLNDSFYNTAFSKEQQQNICTTAIHTSDSPYTGTPGGNDTEDKIFILSVEEVDQYLSHSIYLCAPATLYLRARSCAVDKYTGNSPWVLRSPGDEPGYSASVSAGGALITFLSAEVKAIRPAMWVMLENGGT